MSEQTRIVMTAALLLAAFTAPAVHANGSWIEIEAPASFYDRDGVLRAPSCSGGPMPGLLRDGRPGIVQADTAYSFFVRPGDPRKLAIFFDGGGACWDANTCIGSAIAGQPIYSQVVDETIEELNAAPGLADFLNPANPISSYTQVFIPYCSGDIHTGAKDHTYFFDLDGKPIEWTIHHRGFDNVAAVLHWLTNHYETRVGRAPSRVFLSGASAGGYGVLYAYPAVADLLPRHTRTQVLVDAANGVINQDFYDRALTPGGVWGAWDNLAPELANAFASGPDTLAIEIFKSLGWHYPRTRFGQYTTAFDEVQIAFYNIARHVDSPELWTDPLELAVAAIDWTIRARAYMVLTAVQTWNFRFYLAKGTDHTVIGDNKFYTENSARGVYFSDWVDDMINRLWPWRSTWRNLSCSPDCLP